MKKIAMFVVVIMMAFMANGCGDDVERYTAPVIEHPTLEMCHVTIKASYSYYEDEGYKVDTFHFINGQDKTVYVNMIYAGTDEVAYERTLYALTNRTYTDPEIYKGEDLDVHIRYKDADNNLVDCPGSPAHWGL